ncbi:hypothetical protein QR680_017127 [Steinernema hermaphroditum]|uniref:Uncharacterized protein n=1 Tax=Steinernema hermaphroditum TaxID=289476 RepID=A0AA39HEE7_9BILA|nr:hypothetical protein QR680_017127 [Steinernema hermaphroditum]
MLFDGGFFASVFVATVFASGCVQLTGSSPASVAVASSIDLKDASLIFGATADCHVFLIRFKDIWLLQNRIHMVFTRTSPSLHPLDPFIQMRMEKIRCPATSRRLRLSEVGGKLVLFDIYSKFRHEIVEIPTVSLVKGGLNGTLHSKAALEVQKQRIFDCFVAESLPERVFRCLMREGKKNLQLVTIHSVRRREADVFEALLKRQKADKVVKRCEFVNFGDRVLSIAALIFSLLAGFISVAMSLLVWFQRRLKSRIRVAKMCFKKFQLEREAKGGISKVPEALVEEIDFLRIR